MITKSEAMKTVKKKKKKNLSIVGSWETPLEWVFALGFCEDDGTIRPIFGDNTARISKDDGEILW